MDVQLEAYQTAPVSMHPYTEHTLKDGTRVAIGPMGPQAEKAWERGYARLSARSRYQRFHQGKACLSPREKAYLLDVDQERHIALGAVDLAQGFDCGIGLARYVRDAADPSRAEVAITVIDDYQGRGLGELLYRSLMAHARDKGVHRFENHVMSDNRPMLGLLHKLHGIEVAREEGEACIEVELDAGETP